MALKTSRRTDVGVTENDKSMVHTQNVGRHVRPTGS